MVDAQTFSKEFTDEVEHLFKLGAHLGHKKNRLHPRARKYVHSIINGTSVIDLTLSVAQLVEAKRFLSDLAAEDKTPLVVATKKVIGAHAEEFCAKHDIPYISSKWLPGLLTNFETIMKNVKKLIQMREAQASQEWEKYVKHERMRLEKEMSKLSRLYSGIVSLKKHPDVLIVVDIKKEHNAIVEANQFNIPVVAIADTNSNIDLVSYPVVVNDDAPEVVSYVFESLINAYKKPTTAKKPKETKEEPVEAEAKIEKKTKKAPAKKKAVKKSK